VSWQLTAKSRQANPLKSGSIITFNQVIFFSFFYQGFVSSLSQFKKQMISLKVFIGLHGPSNFDSHSRLSHFATVYF